MLILLLTLLPIAAQAQQWGVVNLSVAHLREQPDYDKEMGDEALMGSVVEILEKESYWLKVRTGEPYTAWVNEMGITIMDRADVDRYISQTKYIVTCDYSNVFERPDASSKRLSDLVAGDLLRIRMSSDGRTPVRKRKFLGVTLPDGREGFVPEKDMENFSKWVSRQSPTTDNIIRTAERFLGVPYLWGGTSIKGVDCSGLTRCAFYLNGLLIQRNASQQARAGVAVDTTGILGGDFHALKKADLLFFGNPSSGKVTHVGIYLGDGRFIHSSQVVRINSLRKTDPDYYPSSPRLLQIRRFIGYQDKGYGIVSLRRDENYFPKK